MKVIILDTETTGLPKALASPVENQPKIIELGAVFVEYGEIKGELSQLLNPKEALPEKIIKITGIKDEDLFDKPTFAEYFYQFHDFVKDVDVWIIHNASFDINMLKIELNRNEIEEDIFPPTIICTVQEYKYMFGNKYPKMVELYEKILNKQLVQSHRALDDCLKLHEILIADNFYDKLRGALL